MRTEHDQPEPGSPDIEIIDDDFAKMTMRLPAGEDHEVGFFVCRRCMALVVSTTGHKAWHDAVTRGVRTAGLFPILPGETGL